ncbi:unnamed protein product [Didymodactylos carnosus]|nr:unnamed protein product [Didymodactylos carnosus]CAF4478592.1 unnamed protein product [Didymodactylos carnosus]
MEDYNPPLIEDHKQQELIKSSSRFEPELKLASVKRIITDAFKFAGRPNQNVKQWLQEFDEALQLVKVSDVAKYEQLVLKLSGEAKIWYQNNKSSLSTWSQLVDGLHQTFSLPTERELAFKQLNSPQQGANEPVTTVC